MARKSSVGAIPLIWHIILTLVTGGGWLLVLIIWALLVAIRTKK